MLKAKTAYVRGANSKRKGVNAPRICDTSLKKFVQNLAFHGGYGHEDAEFLHIVKEVYGVTFTKKGESTKHVKKEGSLTQWINHVSMGDPITEKRDKKDTFCRDNGEARIVGVDSHTILPPALDKLVTEAQNKYRAKK